jgi:hypothetical protein
MGKAANGAGTLRRRANRLYEFSVKRDGVCRLRPSVLAAMARSPSKRPGFEGTIAPRCDSC